MHGGDNSKGLLGLGGEIGEIGEIIDIYKPELIEEIDEKVKTFHISSCNRNFPLCITESGKLYRWGKNYYHLGVEDKSIIDTPTLIKDKVKDVALNDKYLYVFTENEGVYLFGNNKKPERISGIKGKINNIINEYGYTFVIDDNNILYRLNECNAIEIQGINSGIKYIYCIDNNEFYIITDNGKLYYLSKEQAQEITCFEGKAEKIYFNYKKDFLVTEEGHLYSFDKNHNFNEIKGIDGKVAGMAFCRGNSYFAWTEKGDFYVWGTSTIGQLGLGKDVRHSDVPIKMKNIEGCVYAYTDGEYFFINTRDGKLYGWGDNKGGLLGVGDREERNIPVEIKGVKGIVREIDLEDNFDELHGYIFTDNKVYKAQKNSYIEIKGLEGNIKKIGNGFGWNGYILTEEGNLYFMDYETQAFKKIEIAEKIADFIYCKAGHSALTEDGKIYSWGDGRVRYLGYPCGTKVDNPTEVKI